MNKNYINKYLIKYYFKSKYSIFRNKWIIKKFNITTIKGINKYNNHFNILHLI